MKGTAILFICVAGLAAAKPREHQVNEAGCPFDAEVIKFLPHENCHQFYQCVGGTPIALSCPANLLYSTELERCDWPYNVNCEDRIIIENRPEDNNGDDKPAGNGYSDPKLAPEICAAEGSEGVLVAHEKCDRFYVCERGIPIGFSCPENLLYNPKKEQCDWPENVECNERVRPALVKLFVAAVAMAGDAATICGKPDSDGVLLAHETCDHFYKCAQGVPVALSCPAGLLYNINAQYCDWSYNVNCEGRTISGDEQDGNDGDSQNNGKDNNDASGSDGQGHSDPSEAPALCAAEGSDGILVAHEKCDHFYKCFQGKPVALSCPAGLLYHPALEYCDWPQNVDCGNRS